MKIKLFRFLLILIINIPLTAEGENVFTLHQFRGMKTDTISVNELFSDYSVISPFTGKQCLTGLCVDAVVTSTKPDYFVRVLLKDKDNNQYVVMERYPEFYADSCGLLRNISVNSGGVLTITGEVVMANCKMTVKSGGTLVIDGGRLLHADIELEPSSTLRIINGGLLHMKPDLFFSAPLGSFVEIEEGEVS